MTLKKQNETKLAPGTKQTHKVVSPPQVSFIRYQTAIIAGGWTESKCLWIF